MKETFEQLLENNKAKIYRICKIYAVSPLEPQDLFQEVIFAIWKSLPTFKGNSSIDTWIYRITLNICLRSKQKSEKIRAILQTINEIQRKSFKYNNKSITVNANPDICFKKQ